MTNKIQVVIADGQVKNRKDSSKYAQLINDNVEIIYADSIYKLNKILLYANVDILLFSLKQPDGNGIEYIKKIGFQKQMGLIIIADEKNTDAYVMALESGADDFISNSNSYCEIFSKIQGLYRRLK